MSGRRNRPASAGGKLAKDAAIEAQVQATLKQIGIQRTADGGMKLSAGALRTLDEERVRRMTMTRVPNTPRHLPREAGGMGVRKGGGQMNGVSMETLRLIRERAPILQGIHAARAAKVRRVSVRWSGKRGDVGWRVVHKDHYEQDARPPDGFSAWIKRFERILETPAPTYGITSTGPLFGMLEEDLLTLNRPCVEVLNSAIDKRRVVGFRPVDAALIWPTQLWVENWVSSHPDWYGPWSPHAMSEDEALDILSDQMEFDLRTAEYCLVRDGSVEATYDRHQIIVAPFMNRTDINCNGYWPSAVEQAIEIVLTFINTWDYNASFFTRGMMAEFLLGISGNVHPDDMDAFTDTLREATQGVKRAWQPPTISLPEGGAIEKIDLKPSNKEMMYEVFMSLQIALACAIYRMDPSEVNAKPWDGSGSGSKLGGDGGRGMEIALAKEEGLQGDMQHLSEAILTPLARRCHPDLRVVFEYGDFDPQKEAAIYEIRGKTSMTRNEIRLAEGNEPMGFWLPIKEYNALDEASPERKRYEANPWNRPTDPSFGAQLQQAEQLEMQKKQMAQQAQQAQQQPFEEPDDDGFGEPDDGSDDGFGQAPPKTPFGAAPGAPQGATQPSPSGGAPDALRKAVPRPPAKRRVTVYVEGWTE